MPQLSTLVLTDRAATPVARTFVPRDITNGVGTCTEGVGVPISDKRFTCSLTRSKTGTYKARFQLAVPVVENVVIQGITTPSVVRTAYGEMTFTFASNSTEQERKDVVGMLQSALDPAKLLVNDTAVKLQGIY